MNFVETNKVIRVLVILTAKGLWSETVNTQNLSSLIKKADVQLMIVLISSSFYFVEFLSSLDLLRIM